MSEIRCAYCQPKPIIAEDINGKVVIRCRCCKRDNVVGNVKSLEDRTGGHDGNAGHCSCTGSNNSGDGMVTMPDV